MRTRTIAPTTALLLALFLCLPVRPMAAQTVEERIALGRDLLVSARVDDALLQFTAARRAEPGNFEAERGYQDCKLARGRDEQLARIYDALLAESPDDPTLRHLAARVRVRIPDRVHDLREVARQQPQNYEAALDLGRALVRDGQFRDAAESFAAAGRLRPQETAPVLGAAIAHRLRGDLFAAQDALLRAISIDPGCARAYHHLGLMNLDPASRGIAAGRLTSGARGSVAPSYDPAERFLLRAVQLDADYYDAHRDLAKLYYEHRRSRAARKLLLDYMQAHPLDPRPYVSIAEYDIAQGLSEMAENHLQRFLNMAPSDPEVLVNLAVICIKGQRNREAEEHLRHALNLHPRLGSAWLDLGHLYYSMGSYQEATEAFSTALDCDGVTEVEVHMNLARCQAALGRTLRDEAERTPQEESAGAALATELRARSQEALQHARQSYTHALELQPGHGELHLELAKVCLNLGDGIETVKQLELAGTAPAERPSRIEVDYLLACAHLLLGRLEDARQAIDRVLLAEPNHAGGIDLRRQIQRAGRATRK